MLETAWFILALVLGSDAGLSVIGLLTIFWGAVGLLVLWAVRLVLYFLATRRQPARRQYKVWALEPLLIVAVSASVWLGALFWPRFFLSKPALDRYVQTAQAGPPPERKVHFPRRVGLFLVRETEALPNGVVRIITTRCMFDDCGLAYSPGSEPPRIGEDSYTRLAWGWWRWWRSW